MTRIGSILIDRRISNTFSDVEESLPGMKYILSRTAQQCDLGVSVRELVYVECVVESYDFLDGQSFNLFDNHIVYRTRSVTYVIRTDLHNLDPYDIARKCGLVYCVAQKKLYAADDAYYREFLGGNSLWVATWVCWLFLFLMMTVQMNLIHPFLACSCSMVAACFGAIYGDHVLVSTLDNKQIEAMPRVASLPSHYDRQTLIGKDLSHLTDRQLQLTTRDPTKHIVISDKTTYVLQYDEQYYWHIRNHSNTADLVNNDTISQTNPVAIELLNSFLCAN